MILPSSIRKKKLLAVTLAIVVMAQLSVQINLKPWQFMTTGSTLQEANAKAGLLPRRNGLNVNPGMIFDGVDSFCLLWEEQSVDIDDWWTHRPQYVTDVQNGTHQCFRKERSPEKLRLLQRLYNNQFLSGCNNLFKRPLRSAGWGADFNGLGEGVLEALSSQKPMLVVPPPWIPKGRGWMYAVKQDGSAVTCPSMDLQCYFLPTINSTCMNGQSFLELDTVGFDNKGYGIYHANSSFTWAYQYLTRGRSWLRREVVKFVEKQSPRFPRNEPCTVMHVRRGDLVLERDVPAARAYHAISEYLDLLPNERRRAGSNILLLTDDADAVDEARLLHPDLNWHWFNRTRNRGSQMQFGDHIVAATPKDDVVVILGTLEVIKRCDGIVMGRSGFAGLLRDQVVDAWRDDGRDVFLALLKENYTSSEERRSSGKLIAKKLEEAKAKAGLYSS